MLTVSFIIIIISCNEKRYQRPLKRTVTFSEGGFIHKKKMKRTSFEKKFTFHDDDRPTMAINHYTEQSLSPASAQAFNRIVSTVTQKNRKKKKKNLAMRIYISQRPLIPICIHRVAGQLINLEQPDSSKAPGQLNCCSGLLASKIAELCHLYVSLLAGGGKGNIFI